MKPSFAATAYNSLRAAILDGRLPPGTPLSRRRLAGELGMSPVPVGDALTRLEADGFVETRPRAGRRVHIPAAAEIEGNYELREALETHSARLFAERAPQTARQRLLTAAERLDAAYHGLHSGRYSPARHARVERSHIDFHLRIAEATGCAELLRAIEHSRVLIYNWLFMQSAECTALPHGWHSQLAGVLVRHDVRAAEAAMRRHVRYRKHDIVETLGAIAQRAASGDRMPRGPRRRSEDPGV